MFATNQYRLEARVSSILPDLDVSSVAWFIDPNGSTHTGQIEELSNVEGTWWAACRYEQLPGVWILENRHAFNYWAGVGPEFPLQLRQAVWFKRGDTWQSGVIADFYLECGEWFASVSYSQWYGDICDDLPIAEIRTTAPDLDEDPEYAEFVSAADFWADYQYEDKRDNG